MKSRMKPPTRAPMTDASLEPPANLKAVTAFYAERLNRAAVGGAGPALAPDYDPDALARLPAQAAAYSFGCGDPLALADIRPGDTVLDLGCGAGMDVLLAAERVGLGGRIIGVDAAAEMVDRARENIQCARPAATIDILRGEIEALPIPDASIDRVISNCVINLSLDKPAAFREIARVLKPGGSLLVADLVAEPLPTWLSAHADLYAACVGGAVDQAAYLDHAAQAGLMDLRIVGEMRYDAPSVRALAAQELPVAVDAMAERLGLTREALLDQAAEAMAEKVRSIKLAGRKP